MLFFVCQYKNVVKLLLYLRDAAGVFALDDVGDGVWEAERLFLDYLAVLDYVYRDVVVDKAENVKIDKVKSAVDFYYVLFAHFVAAGVFYYGNAAVKLSEPEIIIDIHTFSGFDMVDDEAVFKFSYVQHGSFTSKSVSISAIRTYTPNCTCLKYAARGSLSTSTDISFTLGRGCRTIISFLASSIFALSRI